MGYEQQMKLKMTLLIKLGCLRKGALLGSMLLLFCVTGCVKETPLAKTTSPEVPAAVSMGADREMPVSATPALQEEAAADGTLHKRVEKSGSNVQAMEKDTSTAEFLQETVDANSPDVLTMETPPDTASMNNPELNDTITATAELLPEPAMHPSPDVLITETAQTPATAHTSNSSEVAPAAAEPWQDAAMDTYVDSLAMKNASEMPVSERGENSRDQSFHLKSIEAQISQKKEELTPVSPKILEDKTIETKMPQVVADLAAKSEMYHSIHSPIKEGESCMTAKCHNQMTKLKYAHAPVATGACLVCHANMSEDPPFGLVSTGVDLCWGCHKNQKTSVSGSNYLHKIVKNEGCIGCHDSHGSNATKYLLKKDELTLCVDCHRKETKKVMKHIEQARVVHKPVAEGRCAGCHAPHASNFKKLLKEGPDDMALCFSCHKKMEEQAKSALYKHGPIQEELCSPCHEPHGGFFAKDLKFNFEKKFYNSFDLEVYSLCFKCHKETVVLDKRTIYLTNFRNGDRNLHFLHVNRQKGRTCLACHEVHMGFQVHHIRKSTPFGKWEIPISFTRTPTGGKCSANCHVPKEYDREKPVKLLIDEEEEKFIVGNKVAE